MKATRSTRYLLPALLALASGCAAPRLDTVTQVSTMTAIEAGAYDGRTTCRALQERGNFGIGTFDRLDGEMIILDGVVYQVKANGRVVTPPPSTTTPFACVVSFLLDCTVAVPPGTDLAGLKRLLDDSLPAPNALHAVEVRGTFRTVRTRSVPAQVRPYRPLAEVLKQQPEFTYQDISGALVGFRFPSWMAGVNVPGYHFHFLSDDRKSGGHVLAVDIREAFVAIDACDRFFMMLPRGDPLFHTLKLEAGE